MDKSKVAWILEVNVCKYIGKAFKIKNTVSHPPYPYPPILKTNLSKSELKLMLGIGASVSVYIP